MSLWRITACAIAFGAAAVLYFLCDFDPKSAVVGSFILFIALYDLDRLQKR